MLDGDDFSSRADKHGHDGRKVAGAGADVQGGDAGGQHVVQKFDSGCVHMRGGNRRATRQRLGLVGVGIGGETSAVHA